MIEDNVVAYLLTKTDITNIVTARIYANTLPQKPTLPALTYNRIATERSQTLNTGRPGLAAARLQFDCWGKTYAEVKTLAEKMRLTLQGFSGVLSGGISAQAIHLFGEWDMYEPTTQEFRVVLDFEVWFSES